MKRIIAVFFVLVGVLGLGLWEKIRSQEALLHAPPGGSGVLEGITANVVSRLQSRIVRIHVDTAEMVRAGQVLVELDCVEPMALVDAAAARLHAAERQAEAASAQMQAALGSARAAKASARATTAQSAALSASKGATARQADRAERLRAEGNVTDADYDKITAQRDQLNEQLNALSAQQSAAENQAEAARLQAEAVRSQAASAVAAIGAAQADLRRAEAMARECHLVAPQDGRVTVRALEEGEAVFPGTRILTITNTDPATTTFYLPNRDLARAKLGVPVRILVDAYPDKLFSGTLVRVAEEAEFTPRNVQTREDRDRLVYAVEVRIPNPDGLLRVGMPVEVRIDETP